MPATDPSAQLRVFAHTSVEHVERYRMILRCFVDAKTRFALHLRPRDVISEMTALGVAIEVGEIDAALDQLVAWGNLRADPDTAEVATVEEFHRRRLLYRMTREGEAAESALIVYFEHLESPGELQKAGLDDVLALLKELERLASAIELDDAKVHRALSALRQRFEDLTGRAQTFMGSVRRANDLHGLEESVFIEYKQKLVEYLQGFVRKLIVSSTEIAEATARIEASGLERLLRAAAAREVADQLEADSSSKREDERLVSWALRWEGLCAWFSDRSGSPAQSTVLRQQALSAIPGLLAAIDAIHQRRVQRSDRRGDLLALAGRFARTDTDSDAHRLFRAAFGLHSARHFWADADTILRWEAEDVGPRTAWQDAPAVEISPRLRERGRYTRPGRQPSVVDRSDARRVLAERAEAQARQIERARRQLIDSPADRLSQLGRLDRAAFDLLLDMLGDAFSRPGDREAPLEAVSIDGSVRVVLTSIEGPDEDSQFAVIETAGGQIMGPDCRVAFEDLTPIRSDRSDPGVQP